MRRVSDLREETIRTTFESLLAVTDGLQHAAEGEYEAAGCMFTESITLATHAQRLRLLVVLKERHADR